MKLYFRLVELGMEYRDHKVYLADLGELVGEPTLLQVKLNLSGFNTTTL